MTSVTIFGDGNMGSAIGALLSGTSSVQHITTSTPDATVEGDLVILAVPYPAVTDIVATHGNQLDGKIVVDISNPVNFQTFDSLVVPADGSAAAELAEALPSARVLKAFNTNFAATLHAKAVGDNPTTVLVAGDDADAKTTLIDAVSAGGLNAIDVGALKRARELEAIGFTQLGLAINEKVAWTGGFAVV